MATITYFPPVASGGGGGGGAAVQTATAGAPTSALVLAGITAGNVYRFWGQINDVGVSNYHVSSNLGGGKVGRYITAKAGVTSAATSFWYVYDTSPGTGVIVFEGRIVATVGVERQYACRAESRLNTVSSEGVTITQGSDQDTTTVLTTLTLNGAGIGTGSYISVQLEG